MLFGIGTRPLAPPFVALSAAGNGGWTQKPKARALWYGDHSYLGYDSSGGDIAVVVVPDSTGVGGTPITLHAAFQVDIHAAPALVVLPSDHRLLVLYSGHNGGVMYGRKSVNPLDSDPTISGGFAAEVTHFTGTALTYPMAFARTAESGSPTYCWFREGVTLSYRKTTDDGATWSIAHSIYVDGANRTYWDISLAPDGMRFDFIVTDTDAVDDQLGSIRHFYADATDYKDSSGTPLAGSNPYGPSALTLVYDEATAGKAWAHDLYNDGDPSFLFGIANTWSPAGGTDTAYRYAKLSGGVWATSTILASGGAGQFDPMIGCLDQVDPTRAFVTRKIGSRFEIWRYRTADGGATWDAGAAITSSSADDNVYPVAVKGHPVPGFALVWNNGTYVSATDFSLRILGWRAT
jgi:hypothetical protein